MGMMTLMIDPGKNTINVNDHKMLKPHRWDEFISDPGGTGSALVVNNVTEGQVIFIYNRRLHESKKTPG
jgi:hypothetical protein